MTVAAAGSRTRASSRSYMAPFSISASTPARQASPIVFGAATLSGQESRGGSTPYRAKRASSAFACRSSASTMFAKGWTGPKASITFR